MSHVPMPEARPTQPSQPQSFRSVEVVLRSAVEATVASADRGGGSDPRHARELAFPVDTCIPWRPGQLVFRCSLWLQSNALAASES